MYITESDLLSENYRHMLGSGELLRVSGQPLNTWRSNGDEQHFGDAAFVNNELFVPIGSEAQNIDPDLNRHLPREFLGLMVCVRGINPETQDEYRFAMRDELGFSLDYAQHSQVA